MAATYSSLVGVAVGGKYEIRRVLGIGGMGVVCEAMHLDLGKKVAIKLIDKTMKESELIVARFRREARALGQIQSEHIVDVFDVGADARIGLYMVMEHLAGEDLQSRLEHEKKVDVTTGVMIGHQVARALEKAHAKKVIHRDLKPANVFLTSRDSGGLLVKLLDFGVSKLLEEPGTARITGSGAPIGTPLYMSPEQAEGKDDTDGRADLWSLGAVLYEALSGEAPFSDRGSYHATLVGILTSRPKLLHDVAPWVPPPLAKVVDALLVHDRDARIKDAVTVTRRLLEAFPAVMPDGTGRHTAVIVSQSSPIDAMSDTEVFTAAALAAAQQESRASRPSGPGEDSSRTVPELPSTPVSGEATRTAAATPIEPAMRDSSSPPAISGIASITPPGDLTSGTPAPPPLSSNRRGGTVPFASPSSSSTGVAMPGTPPLIEPLPPSEIAPDTSRDDVLALAADRRRRMMFGAVLVTIVSVAVGAYFVGRRSAPPVAATVTTTTAGSSAAAAVAPPSLTLPTPTTPAVPASAGSPTPPSPPASSSTSAASAGPSPLTSLTPHGLPSAPAPRRRPRPRPSPAPASPSTASPASGEAAGAAPTAEPTPLAPPAPAAPAAPPATTPSPTPEP